MLQQLIINADDFGLTDGVCRAIVELGKAGDISSTTAMLGVPKALPRIAKYWIQLKIPCSVHLHVTYGAPLSAEMQAYCAKHFNDSFPRSRQEIDYPVDLLLTECRAQLDVFTHEFGKPDHFDTHHGFHRDPRYRAGLLALAKEYQLPMRGGDTGQESPTVPESSVLESWSNTGWDDVESGVAKLEEVLKQGKNQQPGKVWELVAHPAYTDEELRAITTLNDRRELERQVLGSAKAKNLYRAMGIQLVNFSALAK